MDESLRWYPLFSALRSKANLVLVLVAIVFGVDLLLGSPLTTQMVLLQLKLTHIDPSRGTLTLMTFFGTLHSVAQYAAILDKAFMLFGAVVAGISFLLALLASAFRR
jgi:hypothetical protein